MPTANRVDKAKAPILRSRVMYNASVVKIYNETTNTATPTIFLRQFFSSKFITDPFKIFYYLVPTYLLQAYFWGQNWDCQLG
jgi:hypothetical protein